MSSRRTYCYINGRVGAVVEHWSLTSLLLLGAAATSSPLLVDERWKKNVKPYPNIFSSLTQDIIIMSLTSCRWRATPHARQLVMDQPHSTFTCPLLPLSDFSPTLLASFTASFVASPRHTLPPIFTPNTCPTPPPLFGPTHVSVSTSTKVQALKNGIVYYPRHRCCCCCSLLPYW